MSSKRRTQLAWIVIRCDDGQHWWVDEFSDEVYQGNLPVSILDPEQVRRVMELLERYHAYGYRRSMFTNAFQAWKVAGQLSDGRLRLVPAQDPFFEGDTELFALPDVALTLEDELEQRGCYADFLEQLEHMRIRYLNSTHNYFRDLQAWEMEEELEARDNDLFFCGETLHVFDEIIEILEWAPAEWDGE